MHKLFSKDYYQKPGILIACLRNPLFFKNLKNIISGDLYWVGAQNNYKYLVVGDCTGHGISAALLSVLAINLFQYAIINKGLKGTDEILKEVDRKFIESFNDLDKAEGL